MEREEGRRDNEKEKEKEKDQKTKGCEATNWK